MEGERVFDLSDPDDLRYATGGWGAGDEVAPGLCCAPGDEALR